MTGLAEIIEIPQCTAHYGFLNDEVRCELKQGHARWHMANNGNIRVQWKRDFQPRYVEVDVDEYHALMNLAEMARREMITDECIDRLVEYEDWQKSIADMRQALIELDALEA